MKVTHKTPSMTPGIEQAKTPDKLQEKAQVQKSGVDSLSSLASASQRGANIEISDKARLMQKANEIARNTPDSRADKVAALKKSISDGSYHINSAAIADRLVDEHLAMDFGKNSL